jgi:arylsulfatase A-like enzyme
MTPKSKLVLFFILLTVFLVSSSLMHNPAKYEWIDVLLLAIVYSMVSLWLITLCIMCVRFGKLMTIAAALIVSGAVVLHLRDQTFWVLSVKANTSIAVIVAMLCYLFFSWNGLSCAKSSPLRLFMLQTLFFPLIILIVCNASNVFRWHLFSQNNLVSMPAYYLLSTPVVNQTGLVPAARLIPRTVTYQYSSSCEKPLDFVKDAAHPNIVFILIDTLRADAINSEQMPNLSRLAERSVAFTNVIANSNWTRPSVASYFTGLLPEQHAAENITEQLALSHTTLAESLKDDGYKTVAFITNYGSVGIHAGFNQGFDSFFELAGQGNYATASEVNQAVFKYFRNVENRKTNTPIFLYIHLLDPHGPIGFEPREDEFFWDRRVSREEYNTVIKNMDSHLNVLLEFLHKMLGNDTAYLVVSDHGEEFGEHGSFGHGQSLYQELLHVPVILVNGQQNKKIDFALEGRDIFDLVLSLSNRWPNFDPLEWAQKRSRSVRYSSVRRFSRGVLLHPFRKMVVMQALITERYKVIHSEYGSTYEMYDLMSDPAELNNIARSERERLVQLIQTMNSEVRVPCVAPMLATPSDEAKEQLRSLGYLR